MLSEVGSTSTGHHVQVRLPVLVDHRHGQEYLPMALPKKAVSGSGNRLLFQVDLHDTVDQHLGDGELQAAGFLFER